MQDKSWAPPRSARRAHLFPRRSAVGKLPQARHGLSSLCLAFGLVLVWCWFGVGLVSAWFRPGFDLASAWLRPGFGLGSTLHPLPLSVKARSSNRTRPETSQVEEASPMPVCNNRRARRPGLCSSPLLLLLLFFHVRLSSGLCACLFAWSLLVSIVYYFRFREKRREFPVWFFHVDPFQSRLVSSIEPCGQRNPRGGTMWPRASASVLSTIERRAESKRKSR